MRLVKYVSNAGRKRHLLDLLLKTVHRCIGTYSCCCSFKVYDLPLILVCKFFSKRVHNTKLFTNFLDQEVRER